MSRHCLTGKPTIVWDNGPGHSRRVDFSNHPEHTQPAEVLSSLLPGQHLCKEGENDGHGTSYPARATEKEKVSGRHGEMKTGQKLNLLILCGLHPHIQQLL